MEEVIVVVFMGDKNEFLEVPRSNALGEPILDFCHSILNLKSIFESLGSGLAVEPCCSIRRVG